MRKQLLSIAKVCKRRSDSTLREVRDITGTMAELAKTNLKAAKTYVKKLVPDSNGDAKLLRCIHETIETLDIIVLQTESVNQGVMPTDRIVSFTDTDARLISKGKPGKRVEFGHVVQIEEVEEGIITGYQVHKGNASDKHHLTPALTRHQKTFKKRQGSWLQMPAIFRSKMKTRLMNLELKT